jgi:hypothetical protein
VSSPPRELTADSGDCVLSSPLALNADPCRGARMPLRSLRKQCRRGRTCRPRRARNAGHGDGRAKTGNPVVNYAVGAHRCGARRGRWPLVPELLDRFEGRLWHAPDWAKTAISSVDRSYHPSYHSSTQGVWMRCGDRVNGAAHENSRRSTAAASAAHSLWRYSP